MIVSHLHRFIFLKTRKTAGTSIEIALSRHCGPDDIITPVTPEDEVLRQQEGGRGPQHHDTEPPAYNHMPAQRVRRLVGEDVWRSYYKFAVERNPWDVVVSSFSYGLDHGSGTQTLRRLTEGPRLAKLARNAKVYRIDGQVAVDRVCRFESLESDLGEVWRHLGLPEPVALPHAKASSPRAGRHYREFYDEETAERVRQEFAATVETFGYRF
jgi:hypothetical protein